MLHCHDEACPMHSDYYVPHSVWKRSHCGDCDRLFLTQIRMVRDLGFFESALNIARQTVYSRIETATESEGTV